MSDFTEQDAKHVIGRLKGDTISCCLCSKPIKGIESHNAWPIMDGRCCETCNYVVVIPKRLEQYDEIDVHGDIV
tara:strand:+ start:502 stop:723 length:222 start_codon:yes stop_codon:yes gene_type:complete